MSETGVFSEDCEVSENCSSDLCHAEFVGFLVEGEDLPEWSHHSSLEGSNLYALIILLIGRKRKHSAEFVLDEFQQHQTLRHVLGGGGERKKEGKKFSREDREVELCVREYLS